MALYTTVRGWVNYRGDQEERAVRQAIHTAAVRAADHVWPHDREFIRNYATQVPAGWHFLRGLDEQINGGFAFWGGWVRGHEAFLIRDQIEAVAAILRPEHDLGRPDGLVGYELQGLFDVDDDERTLEWRIYGGAVHENEREIPLSDEQRIG